MKWKTLRKRIWMFDIIFKRNDSPQYPVRILLMRIMMVRKFTVSDVASEIGLHRNTIDRFLGKETDLSKRSLTRIVEYVEHEKERVGL